MASEPDLIDLNSNEDISLDTDSWPDNESLGDWSMLTDDSTHGNDKGSDAGGDSGAAVSGVNCDDSNTVACTDTQDAPLIPPTTSTATSTANYTAARKPSSISSSPSSSSNPMQAKDSKIITTPPPTTYSYKPRIISNTLITKPITILNLPPNPSNQNANNNNSNNIVSSSTSTSPLFIQIDSPPIPTTLKDSPIIIIDARDSTSRNNINNFPTFPPSPASSHSSASVEQITAETEGGVEGDLGKGRGKRTERKEGRNLKLPPKATANNNNSDNNNNNNNIDDDDDNSDLGSYIEDDDENNNNNNNNEDDIQKKKRKRAFIYSVDDENSQWSAMEGFNTERPSTYVTLILDEIPELLPLSRARSMRRTRSEINKRINRAREHLVQFDNLICRAEIALDSESLYEQLSNENNELKKEIVSLQSIGSELRPHISAKEKLQYIPSVILESRSGSSIAAAAVASAAAPATAAAAATTNNGTLISSSSSSFRCFSNGRISLNIVEIPEQEIAKLQRKNYSFSLIRTELRPPPTEATATAEAAAATAAIANSVNPTVKLRRRQQQQQQKQQQQQHHRHHRHHNKVRFNNVNDEDDCLRILQHMRKSQFE